MDYIEAFQNLKTNNKYSRKTPHKAVLLLTVIDLIEKNIILENIIKYDEVLKESFLQIWNTILPGEEIFQAEPYFPFWHLQRDSFWHIVPIRGREIELRELQDMGVKASESMILNNVQYAELDDDLYFMMTLPSSRAALKRALLETYTSLSPKKIERLAVSEDNYVDMSKKAIKDYESIISSSPVSNFVSLISTEQENKFHLLPLDVQIALNFEYYSFLKKHRYERDLFLQFCPSVSDLYDKICNPVSRETIYPPLVSTYEGFLYDLRIALISENGAMNLIDDINNAIASLQAKQEAPSLIEGIVENAEEQDNSAQSSMPTVNQSPISDSSVSESDNLEDDRFLLLQNKFYSDVKRTGQIWTEEEQEFILLCFKKGWDCYRIANEVGRSEKAIFMRLEKMGYIMDSNSAEAASPQISKSPIEKTAETPEIRVVNAGDRCFLYNSKNEVVFSTTGSLKIFHGKPYRFNYKSGFFTVKAIEFNGRYWHKGGKLLVANSTSDLYRKMELIDCSDEDIDDFFERPTIEENRIKFMGDWYDFRGELL